MYQEFNDLNNNQLTDPDNYHSLIENENEENINLQKSNKNELSTTFDDMCPTYTDAKL